MINGKGLKQLRTYKGYHQKEIADALDVCQQYISKLESSKKILPGEQFDKIIAVMEIPAAEWEQIKYLFLPPPPRKMKTNSYYLFF
ncbi:MAG: helix-turn-helix domain-containing protein [Chitinophagaceae bacterium]|nr:helix-turn-helix domain-containing protein [Chitinophagaceae bacterium]